MLIKVLNKELLKIEIIEDKKISNKYLHISWREFTEDELENFWFIKENNIIKESKKLVKKNNS